MADVSLKFLTLASAVFFVLWSFAVPVFEGPDEYLHWQYARYLHDEWRLPVYGPHFEEANQPPLYYAAIAPIATRTPLPPPLIWADGHDGLAHPFGVRLHLTASDDFTRYWPIRTARLASALIGLVAVYLCGLAAREITGRNSTALLAAGFAAFLPQFTFRGMNVSSDVLVAAMGAWFLYLVMRLVMRGFTWRIGLLAAVALAGAYLSKINSIGLAPVLVLAIVSEPIPWRRRLSHLAVVGVALLLVLPWSYRNIVLYGDPFASGAMYHAVPALVIERSFFDLDHYTNLPREVFKSFVGVFGYGLKLPKWAYAVYLAFMAFAVVGLAKGVRQGQEPHAGADRQYTYVRVLMILIAIVMLNYLVVVRINTQFVQPQGRFMFPALAAVAVAMAVGLERWAPWRRRPDAAGIVTIGAWAAANAAILLLVIVPAYYPPFVDAISRKMTPVELTQADLELSQQIRVPAADARFVIFDIEGRAFNPAVTGSVTLDLEHAGPSRKFSQRVFPFRWLADGRRRTIYVTSLMEPDWQGTVVNIRVTPVDDREKQEAMAVSVSASDVKLAGSIPTKDY